ncbi:hypothetical protein VA596_49790 [Amycolatopsis sp., V23-08]|uniref:RNA polymerase sigma-70 region 4 domain-containing protein n=1 Tax=Amycolatopsis heterodermiae TaxID=3110235 RepID=A0ABU5RN47_9PSEU|nr:hypothetical protein [Amycolatopsis sp., V23-08]MEA5367703.1 hypothetical protein [Amycolatopsis sp., V23-08]
MRRSGLGAADRAAVVQVVTSALPRQVGRINDEDTLVLWLVAAVGREVRRRDAHAVRLQGYVPDVERRTLVTGDVSRLSGREQRFLQVLLETDDYRAVAEELRMPIGSVGPTRARVLRKLRRLLEAGPSADPRADLEAALRAHAPAPESPAPRRGLRRLLGLTTPTPPEVHPGDRTIAAVRDVTGAGRDVLRELDEVLTITRESEDRT